MAHPSPIQRAPRQRLALPTLGPLLLAVLMAYGIWSIPSLIERWGFSIAGIVLLGAWAAVATTGALAVLRKPPDLSLVLLIASAILLARLAIATIALGRMSPGDPDIYPVIARQLLAGQGYYFDQADMGERVWALYPPAYPLLLAGWGAIAGFSTWSLVALNLLIDSAAAWMVARIGRQLGLPGAGRAAALLYLFWPSLIFSAPLAQKEGLATLLISVLASVWLAHARGGRSGWRSALALGAPAGLLALTQPGEAPLAALFGLVLVGQIGWRRVIGIGVAALPIAIMTMLPWWVRNWIIFGAFVPLTSAGGISLWIGNNADATGNWMAQPAYLRGVPELDYARRMAALAKLWIIGHPVDFIRLTLAKFVHALGVGEFGPFRFVITSPPIPPAMAALLLPVSHGGHLLLLGAGAVALRARRAPALATIALLLAACFAQLALFGVWFEFGERHREFITPFLLLAICVAASAWLAEADVGEPGIDRDLPDENSAYRG